MSVERSTAPFDPDQIAFVTRRYDALHGLNNAGIGAALLIPALALSFLNASTAQPISSMTSLMFLATLPPFRALESDVRYRATFGWIEAPFEFATLASWTGLFVMLGAFMDSIIMDRAPIRWPSVLLPVAVQLEPARSFMLLLFACCVALAIESHLDGRGGEPMSSDESDDADTL